MAEQSFPTLRYHPQEPPRVLDTAEDLAALDGAWHVFPWTEEEKAQWLSDQAAAEETPTPPRSRR